MRIEQEQGPVAVKVDQRQMNPQGARQLLSEWFATREANGVDFRENTKPDPDPDARYTVAYEAIFEPSSIEKAQVELWVTVEGEVAIGFETRKRVAERLGVRCRSGRFAAGHEPHRTSAPGLFAFLDLVADGHVAISWTAVPLFGLISTRAVVSHETLEVLVSRGYNPVKWLKQAKDTRSWHGRSLLRFEQW